MPEDEWKSLPQAPDNKTGEYRPDPQQTRPSGRQATHGTPPSPPALHRAKAPAELPEQFGRYRILKKLGQGGMGTVYLAHDPQLERRVALKIPHVIEKDPETLARFNREARAAATFNHPNICPVYDVGEVDGVPYVAMAYIEGRPLSDLVRDGKPLPQRPVAAVIRKLAQALQEAHARGVIHRDLKPANIMINQRKEPVVMDFGLARRADKDAQLTRDGAMLGTPAFMPPEQVLGNVAAMGPGCDIYSLGVMFYQLLTGQLPFQGNVMSVLGRILTEEPRRPTELRPDLDPALEAVCLKAMAKKVEERYRSMAEFAAALGDYLRTGSTQSTPSPNTTPIIVNSQTPTKAETSEKSTDAGLATELLGRLIDKLEVAPAPREQPRRSRVLFWIVTVALLLLLGGIGGMAAYHYLPRQQQQTPPATVVVKLEGLAERVNNPAVAKLFLDGEPITREQLAGEVNLKPGIHELVLKREDGTIIEQLTFTVGDKERQAVQLPKTALPDDRELPDLKPGALKATDIGNREEFELLFTIREIGYDPVTRKLNLTCEAKRDIDYIPRVVQTEMRLYDADDARISFNSLRFDVTKVKKGDSVHATFNWGTASGVKKVLLTTPDEKTFPSDHRAMPPVDTAKLLSEAVCDFKLLEESFVILKGGPETDQQRVTLLLEARRNIEYFPRDVRLQLRFYNAKGDSVGVNALRCEQHERILKGERVFVSFAWGSKFNSFVTKVAAEPVR